MVMLFVYGGGSCSDGDVFVYGDDSCSGGDVVPVRRW